MGRSSRSTGKGVWFAGAAVAVVLALTGYAMFSGDDDGGDAPGKAGSSSSVSADPKPSESYAQPDDWTDPQRWAALPRGKRTDEHGSEVEFPHTTEGAVAALAAANTSVIEGTRSNVDEQLRLYYSYVAKEDQSEAAAERVELGSIDNGKAISREMGLKPGAPMPSGAYMRSHVVGFKVVKASPDQVTMWLLSRVTQKAGETVAEKGSYSRLLFGAKWEGTDWKLSVSASKQAQQDVQGQAEPKMVAPGDAEFNVAGWTAIREAS
ncbi:MULTISPECIES: hypothetical protein [Streptomyces]|uniref:hypothetical protein n=1 Tax=Streptomyces TaxID=1883 RepID=UPI0005BC8F67|nr:MULTISPECIES: hypothetical protein [Streptomyces]MDP9954179.1 hypothetical protein [Streptomyces sp. DSM 41269]